MKCSIVGDSNVADYNGFDITALSKRLWPNNWKLQVPFYRSGGKYNNLRGKILYVLDYAKPGDVVILVIGCNDLRFMTRNRGSFDPWKIINEIISRIRTSSDIVYIGTPLPSPCYGPDEEILPPHLRNPTWCPYQPCGHEYKLAANMRIFKKKLEEVVTNIRNIRLMDLTTPFMNSNNTADRKIFKINDIHLTAVGQKVLGFQIVNFVAKNIKFAENLAAATL